MRYGFDLGFYLDCLHAGSEQPVLPFSYFRGDSVGAPLGTLGNDRYRSNCRFALRRSANHSDRRIQQQRIQAKRLRLEHLRHPVSVRAHH